jgi:hypothetical protein
MPHDPDVRVAGTDIGRPDHPRCRYLLLRTVPGTLFTPQTVRTDERDDCHHRRATPCRTNTKRTACSRTAAHDPWPILPMPQTQELVRTIRMQQKKYVAPVALVPPPSSTTPSAWIWNLHQGAKTGNACLTTWVSQPDSDHPNVRRFASSPEAAERHDRPGTPQSMLTAGTPAPDCSLCLPRTPTRSERTRALRERSVAARRSRGCPRSPGARRPRAT